jgi:Coenzyme PQQ synthesis protein D (PqqD)
MPDQVPRIRSTHTADGGIVMNIESGKMFSLNPSGSVMFQLLTQGLDEKAIVDELVRRFEIPPTVAKHDLSEFRSALNGHGLIRGKEVVPQE